MKRTTSASTGDFGKAMRPGIKSERRTMKRMALVARSCMLLFRKARSKAIPMLCAAMASALSLDLSQAADVRIPVVNVALPKSADDPAPAGSIGFDDLIYDEATKSILLPGGRSGNIY